MKLLLSTLAVLVLTSSVARADAFTCDTTGSDAERVRAATVKGDELAKTGDANGSLVCFELARRLDPSDVYAAVSVGNIHYTIAMQRRQEGLLDKSAAESAADAYAKADELKPNDSYVHFRLSILAYLLGRDAVAQQHGRALLALTRDNADALTEIVNSYLDLEMIGFAADFLQRLHELRPDDFKVTYVLGRSLSQLELYKDALPLLESVVAKEDVAKLEQFWFHLALARENNGQPEAALAAYRKALELRPDYGTARFREAIVLNDLGRFGETAALLADSVGSSSMLQLDMRIALGVAYEGLKNNDGAAAQYRAIIAANPGYVSAHYRLGMLLKDAGELKRAGELLDAQRASAPGVAEMYLKISVAEDAAGFYDASAAHAKSAYDSGVESKLPVVQYQAAMRLGLIAYYRLNRDEALAWFNKADAAAQGQGADAQTMLARLGAELGNFDAAIEHYKKLNDLVTEKNPEVLFQIGFAYEQKQDKASAERYYLEAYKTGGTQRLQRLFEVTDQLIDASSYDAAASMLQEAVRIAQSKVDKAAAYGRLAVIFQQQERHAEAIDNARKALELQPYHLMAKAVLSTSLLAQGDYAGAKRYVQDVLAQTKDSPEFRLQLGLVWEGLARSEKQCPGQTRQGCLQRAIIEYSAVPAGDTRRVTALLHMGDITRGNPRYYEEAVRLLEGPDASKTNADPVVRDYWLAILHGRLDDDKKAVEQLREGLALVADEKKQLESSQSAGAATLPTTKHVNMFIHYDMLRLLADRTITAGDFDEAIRLATEGLRIAPKNGDYPALFHVLIGIAKARKNEYTSAESELRLALTLTTSPRPTADARFWLANIAYARMRVATAIDELRKAIATGQSLYYAHNNLAYALFFAGRYEDAVSEIDQALKTSDTDTFFAGRVLFQQSLELAAPSATLAPDLGSSELRATLVRLETQDASTMWRQYFGFRLYDRAVQRLRAALPSDTTVSTAHVLGEALEAMGDDAGALKVAEDAAAANPDHPLVALDRLAVEARLGKVTLDDFRKRFEPAVKATFEDDSRVQIASALVIAKALLSLGKLGDAAIAYGIEQATALTDPDKYAEAAALWSARATLERAGKSDEWVESMDKALKIDRVDPEANRLLTLDSLARGNYDDALAAFRRSYARLHPRVFDARVKADFAAVAAQNFEFAMQGLLRTRLEAGDAAMAHLLFATLLRESGAHKGALWQLSKAAELDSRNPLILLLQAKEYAEPAAALNASGAERNRARAAEIVERLKREFGDSGFGKLPL
ncbi:MAG: tetratricopeptide repeat protein [Deltaproteobacteria bacterium]|nr:tetratricopeptide repeat protein [Deltaproteobacteria bacterium]